MVARATETLLNLATTCGWQTPPPEAHWPIINESAIDAD